MTTTRTNRGRGLPLLALAILVVSATVVAEVERRSGDTVVVESGEVVADDLYAIGDTVRIDGTVRGDLVALAGEVIVAGSVEGDVIAAGQAVSITGTVGDDARVAGQIVQVASGARVADDLVAAAFSVETQADSSIGGSVLVAAYQALLAGVIDESVQAALGALAVAGTVGGDVEANVGPVGQATPPMFGPPPPLPIPTVASGLNLEEGARIGGDLRYQGPDEADIASGAQVAGEVVYQPTTGDAAPTTGDRVLDGLRRLVALLLVGGLLLLLAPRWFTGLADTVRTKPLPSLGWGLVGVAAAIAVALVLAIVATVVAILLGMLTLGGLAATAVGLGVLGELALAFALVVAGAYLAAAVTGLAAGRLALAREAEPTRGRLFAALALGVAVLVTLGLVPYLGTLIGFLVILLGLGALWLWGFGRFRGAREPAI